jgi:predicted PurR-regulated permease PerM
MEREANVPGGRQASNEAPRASRIESAHYVRFVLATFITAASLYLARVVFEPIAFALLGMALVWPFQRALEAKLPKPVALGLTILLALLVMLALAAAVVWSGAFIGIPVTIALFTVCEKSPSLNWVAKLLSASN